jgi:transcriptional regulator with XRE-family HTH domain
MRVQSGHDQGAELADSDFSDYVRAAERNRELVTWLARWRSEHGLSQDQVAKRMHTSQPAVARLESHQHDAQLSTLARYITALGLSMNVTLTDRMTGEEIWTSVEEPEVDELAEGEQATGQPGHIELKPWQNQRAGAHAMAEKKALVVYAAAYETVDAALADLDAIEQLHMDVMIGQYDAAVIDNEDGKPHVVKRMDRPHIRVIPEWFGGGMLPRKELHEAAEQLTANQAGLIAVGEPTIEQGLDKALTKAAKVVKRTVEATTDEIASELQEALKS